MNIQEGETMFKTFHNWLYKDIYFRYGFFVLLSMSVILGFILPFNSNLYILYIFSVVFLGIGFYEKSAWFVFSLTLVTVLFRFFFIHNQESNVETFLTLLLSYLIISFISMGLRKNVQRVNNDQLDLVTSLANALDSRDHYTMNHSNEVARYSLKIAQNMGLSIEICKNVQMGGLLHDIGKIGIPESILNKPGNLTDDEFSRIQTHPIIGFQMMDHITSFHDNGVLDIILYHHERYDGKGYPKGLKGEQIPLGARIIAVADAYDAMRSNRVYRNQLDIDYAIYEIRHNRGKQFDPKVVDAFLGLFDENQYSSEPIKKSS